MRVLLSSTSGAGHFGPLVPIAEGLVSRGDEVLFVVPQAHRQRVEALGQPFRIAADPPADELADIWDRATRASREEAAVLVNREIFGRLDTAAMLPAVKAAFAEFAPDLVLHEAAEFAAAITAHRAGILHAQIAIGLASIEDSSLELIAPALDPYGADIESAIRQSPYVTRLPVSLDPSPYPTTHRFREPAGASDVPVPDWWDASLADAPLVYVSFGSIAGGLSLGSAAYRAAVAAAEGLEARVLLTTGRTRSLDELGPLPDNVHAERWVAQDDLLLHADLVVCHGGAGTTFGAIAASVPLVFVPIMADQPTNARLVAEAGAGVLVATENDTVDANALRTAIDTVLENPSFRDVAKQIAVEMESLPTVDGVLDVLTVRT